MTNVAITEIDELDTHRVDAVVKPASGIPFLLLKSLEKELDGEETYDERTDAVRAALKLLVFAGEDESDLAEKWVSIWDMTDSKLVYRDPVEDNVFWKREYSYAEGVEGADPTITFADPTKVEMTWEEVGGEAEEADDATKSKADADAPAAKADGDGTDLGGSIESPGSPEWEAADAEALTAVATELARLAARLGISLDRERMEYSAGEADDWRDIDAVSYAVDCVNTALNLVAGLSFREAVEGDTESAEKSIRADLSDAFIKARDTLNALLGDTPAEEATMDLPNITELIKSATADDATDEAKEQLDELRKALGLDGVATNEDLAAKITESDEASKGRIDALEVELEEVKKAAAPGGPVKTRTTQQQDAADKVDTRLTLQKQIDDFRSIADNAIDRETRDAYLAKARELEEEITRLPASPA